MYVKFRLDPPDNLHPMSSLFLGRSLLQSRGAVPSWRVLFAIELAVIATLLRGERRRQRPRTSTGRDVNPVRRGLSSVFH